MDTRETKKSVEFALNADARLNSQDITVSLNDGKVTLKGSVPNFWQRRLAEEIAKRIEGVTSLSNELQVVTEPTLSDSEIEEAVQAALIRDVWVDHSDLDVQVINSVVYLSGTVDNFADKDVAEEDTWSIKGVSAVVNNLAVVPSVPRSDEEIQRRILQEIIDDARLRWEPVNVKVENGVVFLSGSISSPNLEWLLQEIARRTRGVIDVIDELTPEAA